MARGVAKRNKRPGRVIRSAVVLKSVSSVSHAKAIGRELGQRQKSQLFSPSSVVPLESGHPSDATAGPHCAGRAIAVHELDAVVSTGLSNEAAPASQNWSGNEQRGDNPSASEGK